MTAQLIDGTAIANQVKEEIAEAVARMQAEHGYTPGLATVLVGEDPASATYVRMKQRTCEKLGIRSIGHVLPADASQEEVINLVASLNADPAINDQLMASLPERSIVINATGMGKDSPGSPITDAGLFPRRGIAWEFNYRGELDFMHQALRQVESRELRVEDGWIYFVHGWSQVVAQVLHVDLTPEVFDALERAAASVK